MLLIAETLMLRFAAQWQDQDAILIAWPHKKTDWQPWLKKAEQTYIELVHKISAVTPIVILIDDCLSVDDVKTKLTLNHTNLSSVNFISVNYDDTWVRDFGVITLVDDLTPKITQSLNFTFNAWGDKFANNLDNLINSKLESKSFFRQPLKKIDFILEGGSIETDGQGTLLTTETCLLNPNRNKHLSQQQIEGQLKQLLNVDRVLWLKHGHLSGDDTDAHIDTLARFVDAQTIVFQGCTDLNDENYIHLNKMKDELLSLKTKQGFPYRLIELPLAQAQFDIKKNRLPASYVNFLISHKHIFVPFYGCKQDQIVLNQLKQALPNYSIRAINCRTLIEQFGSLHCITMQLPKYVMQ